MNFVLRSKSNKQKSTEILLLLLTVHHLLYNVYMRKGNAESQNKVHNRSTMKEDDSALLVYLLISLSLALSLCVLQAVMAYLVYAVNNGRFYFEVFINSEDHKSVNTSGAISNILEKTTTFITIIFVNKRRHSISSSLTTCVQPLPAACWRWTAGRAADWEASEIRGPMQTTHMATHQVDCRPMQTTHMATHQVMGGHFSQESNDDSLLCLLSLSLLY